MSRRVMPLLLLAVLACGAATIADAADPKPARIGLMSIGAAPTAPPTPQGVAFLEGTAAPGYVEGRNVVFERRFARGNPERLHQFAAELVHLKVDVIVVTGTREVQAARAATATIPIITTVAPDPVALGLVTSLARPGGDVTGLTYALSGFGQKWVELLREAVPTARRMAVLASRPPASGEDAEMRDAARVLNVTLMPMTLVKGVDDFDGFFVRARRDGVGGVIVLSGGVTNLHGTEVVAAAVKHRMPTIYPRRDPVDHGGLMSSGPSYPDLFRRAATFVDKILKGAKPAELPMEQPTKFELVVNLKTAKTLGLTFPPTILARADEMRP